MEKKIPNLTAIKPEGMLELFSQERKIQKSFLIKQIIKWIFHFSEYNIEYVKWYSMNYDSYLICTRWSRNELFEVNSGLFNCCNAHFKWPDESIFYSEYFIQTNWNIETAIANMPRRLTLIPS